ncbi:MAG: hypothetical protein ABIL68_09335 [bacterium]
MVKASGYFIHLTLFLCRIVEKNNGGFSNPSRRFPTREIRKSGRCVVFKNRTLIGAGGKPAHRDFTTSVRVRRTHEKCIDSLGDIC